jgi:hypothetical protein
MAGKRTPPEGDDETTVEHEQADQVVAESYVEALERGYVGELPEEVDETLTASAVTEDESESD